MTEESPQNRPLVLSPKEIFTLRKAIEKTNPEIAADEGVAPGTIASRLGAVLDKMQGKGMILPSERRIGGPSHRGTVLRAALAYSKIDRDFITGWLKDILREEVEKDHRKRRLF